MQSLIELVKEAKKKTTKQVVVVGPPIKRKGEMGLGEMRRHPWQYD